MANAMSVVIWRHVSRYGVAKSLPVVITIVRNSVKRNRRDGRAQSQGSVLFLRMWTYRRCSECNQLNQPEKEIRLEDESGEERKEQRGEVR